MLADERFQVVKTVWWLAVKEAFPKSLESNGLALRSNWEVVTTKQSEPDVRMLELPPVLGALLAAGILADLTDSCDCEACQRRRRG